MHEGGHGFLGQRSLGGNTTSEREKPCGTLLTVLYCVWRRADLSASSSRFLFAFCLARSSMPGKPTASIVIVYTSSLETS